VIRSYASLELQFRLQECELDRADRPDVLKVFEVGDLLIEHSTMYVTAAGEDHCSRQPVPVLRAKNKGNGLISRNRESPGIRTGSELESQGELKAPGWQRRNGMLEKR
jgi:hypothetical protein